MNIKRHIPNAITCGNLLCGCLAIVCAFQDNLIWSAFLVGIAAVLDFFDGFAARLLKVSSPIGKDLDSLADVVTFGVVPGVVMFQMIKQAFIHEIYKEAVSLEVDTISFGPDGPYFPIISYIAFSITVFSAIRLAKFNVDTRQSDSFIGVPTPANSILICSLPLILEFHRSDYGKSLLFLLNPYLLICITLVTSYLLVAELPLFALKFKNFGWADNKIRYTFLIISLVLLIVFQFIAIPFIIILYIIMSVISNIFNKKIPNA